MQQKIDEIVARSKELYPEAVDITVNCEYRDACSTWEAIVVENRHCTPFWSVASNQRLLTDTNKHELWCAYGSYEPPDETSGWSFERYEEERRWLVAREREQ